MLREEEERQLLIKELEDYAKDCVPVRIAVILKNLIHNRKELLDRLNKQSHSAQFKRVEGQQIKIEELEDRIKKKDDKIKELSCLLSSYNGVRPCSQAGANAGKFEDRMGNVYGKL